MRRIICLSVLILSCVSLLSAAEGAPKKVACVGDSITYGSGTSDRDSCSYPAVLQRMLGEGYTVGNFGKPGATLLRRGHRPYMVQEEFRRAMEFGGDIAVVHLGINDTDPRDWPNYRDDFVADYLALLDSLRKANGKVRIIIARTTPITHNHHRFRSGTKQWHDEINETIDVIACAADAELIDFHEPLHPHPELIPDAVHPNDEGAAILAKAAYGGITGDYGGLHMDEIYGDGMVLQRGVPLRIAGRADAGESVRVSLGGKTLRTKASNRGEWSVSFDPMEVARGLRLKVATKGRTLEYNDVAVGEVWLCSGQSNMRFELREGTEIPPADSLACDDIRLFDKRARWNTANRAWCEETAAAVNRLEFFERGSWQKCSSESAMTFSAVGYYFARMLQDSLKMPVGVICNAVGGATAESWIDRQTLETEFPAILDNWLKNDFIQAWARKRAAKNMSASKSKHIRHPYEPCYLFESAIKPLGKYPLRGVVWYQGESNAHNFSAHEHLFRLLVRSWRGWWDNPQMPFHFVQLSSLSRPSWGWFRDSQRRLAEEIDNCGMAVSLDRGDSLDVHPKRKMDVGRRLARLALANDYGFGITPCGPLVKGVELRGKRVLVTFRHGEILKTSDGAPIRGFELAGED